MCPHDDAAALRLKLYAVAAVFFASAVGVAVPLVGRRGRLLNADGSLFFFAKAFAAGVILATGFVHMLRDAESALTDPSIPDSPWKEFPFSGFIAMLAALATLVVDFVGTQYYESKNSEKMVRMDEEFAAAVEVEGDDKDAMHIVGMHAHVASHRHSHAHGPGKCEEVLRRGHGHGHGEEDDTAAQARHVVVSQILELGIVSHSVIIGLSLGVSRSPCTIRPLIAALSFHQFFEGFALGGCISQAQFSNRSSTLMACFFAITTPGGIGVGAAIASFYNANSARALVVEGILDSISAGILIYMALVDLIATDFHSRRMSCNIRLMVASYFALFLGAGLMSSLAIWA